MVDHPRVDALVQAVALVLLEPDEAADGHWALRDLANDVEQGPGKCTEAPLGKRRLSVVSGATLRRTRANAPSRSMPRSQRSSGNTGAEVPTGSRAISSSATRTRGRTSRAGTSPRS